MRIVMKQYADGDPFAVETATDGSVDVRDLLGTRKAGMRISAYADVACDDNEKGLERLEKSLEWLLEEVRRRRGQPAGVANGDTAVGKVG
jgi:acetyl-CoA carboxylase carboxyltransferase component